MFAYIPARGGSKRIKNKNIKILGNKPVILHVIENLRSANIKNIAVSTDDPETKELALNAGAIVNQFRSPDLSNDDTGFVELIKFDLPRYIDEFGSKNIFFVLATAGLVTPIIFNEAMTQYKEQKPALLLATTSYSISPFWALFEDKKGNWKPLFPSESQLSSQDHPRTCVDAGLFFAFNWDKCSNLENLLDAAPLSPFPVPEWMAIDVDTDKDWEKLEETYKSRVENL